MMGYCEFLDAYSTYTEHNETPEIMHLWCGMSVLAGVAEKKIWLDRGMFNLYLNLFVILVAPPGVCAKSTSVGIAADMLKRAGVIVVEGVSTKERIIEDLYSSIRAVHINDEEYFHSSITFMPTEVNTLLSTGIDMVMFLTAIWDVGKVYEYRTKTQGIYELTNPYLNMLGPATPEWFCTSLASDLVNTGFLARCIIVYAVRKRGRYPKTIYGVEQEEAKRKCEEILNWVGAQVGEIVVSAEAEQYFTDWYMSIPDVIYTDAKLAGYYERKAKVFVLKIASLLALGNKRMVVDVEDFENALKLLERTEPGMRAAYSLVGQNKLAPSMRVVVAEILRRGGTTTVGQIMQGIYNDIDGRTMAEVLRTLGTMGLISGKDGKVTIIDREQAEAFALGGIDENNSSDSK